MKGDLRVFEDDFFLFFSRFERAMVEIAFERRSGSEIVN